MREALLPLGLALLLCMSAQTLAQELMVELPSGTAPDTSSEYVELEPSFVTNYGGPGPLHYLKADIVVRVSGGEAGKTAVRHHMPQLRHSLVMLLSRQMPEDISTMEGKELLRQQALQAVQELLREEEGSAYIDDLLFNSFLVQR